jgi:hypothetical protein
MATVTRRSTALDKLAWYLGHCRHSQWDKFNPDEQTKMVEDDLFAGRSVSLVLVSLIAVGMVLSAVTLLGLLAAS